jgi:ribosomal protein S12 methylthiotransferase
MPRNAPRVFCLSLGCSKNKVDSEKIAGAIASAGYIIADEAEGADVVVINTCGFIREAAEENIAAILDAAGLKSRGNIKRVGVVGCLVARYGDALKREMPEVDFWAGCEDLETILEALPPIKRKKISGGRKILPGSSPHVRYLKISEGCDMTCSFCAIPSIRGPMRSRTIKELAAEASSLAEDGAAEICLVAQDLASYGRDLGGGQNLIALLDALETSLPGGLWLRLTYLQPSGVDKRLLERVASGRLVVPYLDVPIQHSSPKILERMNRGDGRGLAEIFAAARAIRPDFALRTTCMVGFPGETRGDFSSLLKFLEHIRFDRLGAFVFSPEEGTPAAGFDGQIPNRTKRARLDRLMTLQAEISLSRQELFAGRELDVLVETVNGDGSAEGRSFREAPEVDGVIEFASLPLGVTAGSKIKARITRVFEHDMEAEAVLPASERAAS